MHTLAVLSSTPSHAPLLAASGVVVVASLVSAAVALVCAVIALRVATRGAAASAVADLTPIVHTETPPPSRLRRASDHAPFETLVVHCADVLVVIGRDGLVQYANPALNSVFGYPHDLVIGQPFRSLVTEELGALADERMAAALSMLAGESIRFEIDVVAGDQSIRPAEVIAVSCVDSMGRECLVLTMRDLTDFRTIEAELSHQAFHDPLTGLPNRALFLDRVDQALRRRPHSNADQVTLLYLDLDGFKGINDTMGHDAGDELLQAVGYRLVGCLRSADTVARMGGDEFAILMGEGSSVDDGLKVAERVLEVLSLPLDVIGQPIAVQASIGLAVAGSRTTTESLLRAADLAMLQAKQAGKARVFVHDATTEGI